MKIFRAYKTELAPDDAQLAALYRHAGAARFAYNWGLEWKSNVRLFNLLPHPKLKTPTAVDLHRELNRLKKSKLSWMYEVSKCAPQEALRDLDAAFSNFFGHRAGLPNFKSRKRDAGSFTLTGAIIVRPGEVRLPRIGWVRLKERCYMPSKAHINSITVSERAKRWYVAVNVAEERNETITPLGPLVGVDRGLNSLAVVSDGTVLDNPRVLRRYEKKLKHLQRNLSRKQKGSSNRRRAREALARLNMRVASTRLEAIQKFTTMLAKTKPVIVVEDLDVKNMMGNHPPRKGHRRRCLGRDLEAAAVQDPVVRVHTHHGGQVVPVDEEVLEVRAREGRGDASGGARLPLRGLRPRRRPRPQRREEPRGVAGSCPDTRNACGGRSPVNGGAADSASQ